MSSSQDYTCTVLLVATLPAVRSITSSPAMAALPFHTEDLATIASYFINSYHFDVAEDSRSRLLCERTSTDYNHFRATLRRERAAVEEARRQTDDGGYAGDALERARKKATVAVLLQLIPTVDDGREREDPGASLQMAVETLHCSWVPHHSRGRASSTRPGTPRPGTPRSGTPTSFVADSSPWTAPHSLRTPPSRQQQKEHQLQNRQQQQHPTAPRTPETAGDAGVHKPPQTWMALPRRLLSQALQLYLAIGIAAFLGWTYYVNVVWSPSHFDDNPTYYAADQVFLSVGQNIASLHPVVRSLSWSIDAMTCETWKTRQSLGCSNILLPAISSVPASCNTGIHTTAIRTLPFKGQQDRCEVLAQVLTYYLEIGKELHKIWLSLLQVEDDFEIFIDATSRLGAHPAGLTLFIDPIRTPTRSAVTSPPHWLPLTIPYALYTIAFWPVASGVPLIFATDPHYDSARASVRNAWRHSQDSLLHALVISKPAIKRISKALWQQYRAYPDIQSRTVAGFTFPQEYVVGLGMDWQFQAQVELAMPDERGGAHGEWPEPEERSGDAELAIVSTISTLIHQISHSIRNNTAAVAKWEKQGAPVHGWTDEATSLARKGGRKARRVGLRREWEIMRDGWLVRYMEEETKGGDDGRTR